MVHELEQRRGEDHRVCAERDPRNAHFSRLYPPRRTYGPTSPWRQLLAAREGAARVYDESWRIRSDGTQSTGLNNVIRDVARHGGAARAPTYIGDAGNLNAAAACRESRGHGATT